MLLKTQVILIPGFCCSGPDSIWHPSTIHPIYPLLQTYLPPTLALLRDTNTPGDSLKAMRWPSSIRQLCCLSLLMASILFSDNLITYWQQWSSYPPHHFGGSPGLMVDLISTSKVRHETQFFLVLVFDYHSNPHTCRSLSTQYHWNKTWRDIPQASKILGSLWESYSPKWNMLKHGACG